MANKGLFSSAPRGKTPPAANTVNSHGAPAYKPNSVQEALAQYVATGCLTATFYASAEEQLDKVLELAAGCDPDFIAKAAIYGRQSAFMKDAPALLVAHLTTRGPEGLAALRVAFPRVIDNPKMLRTFVQILRSGKVGRKSLGSAPKKLIQGWFGARSDVQLFRGAVGNDPSLSDVIKMVHPKPTNDRRKGLYAYLIGKEHDVAQLDELIQSFEAWKLDPTRPVPDVPFMMLTSAQLSGEQWKSIARQASWHTLRMNLNTFQRHGVFEDRALLHELANKLRDEKEIKRARVFPYQLLVAYMNTSDVPIQLQTALQDAMEIATSNVPEIQGRLAVFPDVSGSMSLAPVTGFKKGATTKVMARDVAALVAATLLRKNPDAIILPFKEDVVRLRINPRDSIVTIAKQIQECGSGGTNCSAPLRFVNHQKEKLDMVVFVSDNESWMDSNVVLNSWTPGRTSSASQMMVEWEALRSRCPKAKLVCIDLAPNNTRQAPTRDDVLNVGGFSDEVFTLISEFSQGASKDHWVKKIESTPV